MNLDRDQSQLKNSMLLQQFGCRNFMCGEAELAKCAKHTFELFGIRPYQNIEVAGEAGRSVKATAYPPTIRKSTFLAFNKAQRSAKSLWTSITRGSLQGLQILPS